MNEPVIIAPPPNRLIRLNNRTCIYCGSLFSRTLARTDEHVIGRKFVPRGSLAGAWNLLAQACKKCNGEKSDLENDISVISMLPNGHVRSTIVDPLVASEVRRKAAGSISRRTGKPVADSAESVQLNGQFGPAAISFTFTCAPQIDHARICELARFHVQAFFYQMSFDMNSRTGRFLFGDFHLWSAATASDWGNHKLRWFATQVKNWSPRLRADGARGFFRIHLRFCTTLQVMSWALEWNKGMRVVGFTGDANAISAIISSCPVASSSMVHEQGNERLVFREHVPLADEDDLLFGWEEYEDCA